MDCKVKVKDIYDRHKIKLNNLKHNLAHSEELEWSDVEINSCEQQIRILASILSDLHIEILTK